MILVVVGAAACAWAQTPLPSAAQIMWMQDEIGAIGHFNMV